MSIKGKLAILAAVPLLALGALGVLGGTNLWQASQKTESVVQQQFLPLINEDLKQLLSCQASVKLVLEADRDAHQAIIAEKMALAADAKEDIGKAAGAHRENLDQMRDRMTSASLAFDDRVTSAYQAYHAKYLAWREKTEKAVLYANTPGKLDFARKISTGSAQAMFDEMRAQLDSITQMMDDRIAAAQDRIQQRRAQATAAVTAAHQLVGRQITHYSLIALGSMLLVIAIAVLCARGILGPMRRVIVGLTEGANQVGSAADQILAASQDLAGRTSDQAASLEETSAALIELATTTRTNADHSQSANQLMGQTRQIMGRSLQSVAEVRQAMLRIQESSGNISKIIKTIEEIAFQTNLLALNAAVEAARAGEAGKGFAVVAEEVRSLAQRAAGAARDTYQLIDEAISRVKAGSTIVGTLESHFGEVDQSSSATASLISQISLASDKQAITVSEVNQAMGQIDKVTQENAANAEESAAAVAHLQSQAHQMHEMVGQIEQLLQG